MSNTDVIESKVSFIRQQLGILEKYKQYSQAEIENDDTLRGAVERYLYLAVQAAIDLAEAVTAHKDLRRPSSYSENFYILRDADIISADLMERLIKMAGFRNIIAHGYTHLKFEVVYDALQNRLADIGDFIAQVKTSLNLANGDK